MLGITGIDRSELAAKALAVFFFFLPFAYALQVLTRSQYVPVLGYLLLGGTMIWLILRQFDGVRIRDLDAISVGFIFLIFHHVVTSWAVAGQGDAGLMARVLVLYTVPLVLFWVPRAISLDGLELILRCIAVAALLVSIELIYENVSTQVFEASAYFQLLNKSYLHEVLNLGEMGQLWWPGYRAAGLIEHPHATALFCNVGMFVAALLYDFRGRGFYLASSLICAFAVLTQGFRVPLVSQVGLIALFAVFASLDVNTAVRRRAFVFLSLYTLLVLCIFVVDPTNVVQRYYLTGAQGNFQLPNNEGVGSWIRYTAGDLIRQSYYVKLQEGDLSAWALALFGHGLLGSLSGRYPFSDDMFLLALPLQYGILGVGVFTGIWLVSIWAAVGVQMRYQGLQVPMQLRMFALISLCVVILLALSMAHSGVLQRKAIYPLFPFFIGVLVLTGKEYQKIQVRASKPPLADISVSSPLK